MMAQNQNLASANTNFYIYIYIYIKEFVKLCPLCISQDSVVGKVNGYGFENSRNECQWE